MFRPIAILVVSTVLVSPTFADARLGIPIPLELPARPTSVSTALPYVRLVHQVLDTVTTRDYPSTMRAKLLASESRSEWIVHRVKANIWVEKVSSNYLGQVGVRVSIPCHVEFSLDMGAVRHGQFRYDPARRLLIVDLPPVQMRPPVPLLDEMQIEPMYKGLRGMLTDAEKVRRLQEELMKEDYMPAAREAALEVYDYAQRRARDQVQQFLKGVFAQAGADVEVVVR